LYPLTRIELTFASSFLPWYLAATAPWTTFLGKLLFLQQARLPCYFKLLPIRHVNEHLRDLVR
jgi:hypothetical protein